MNKFMVSVLTFGFILGSVGNSFAVIGTQTFTVSATVPLPSGVSIAATSINSTSSVRTAVSGTALSFDPLTFNTTNQIWLPDHYYAIDIGPGGGPGATSAVVSYTEGTNPNSAIAAHGLGWKSTATFFKVSGSGASTVEASLSAHGPKKMLKDLVNENVTTAELTGGTLRMYVGIVTKDPTAVIPDPAASEVISNADRSGTYTGSLLITATVV